MATALQIITGAARLLQALRKGEAMAADEAAEGLTALNEMIASWSNESLLIPARVTETFSVSAASSYTLGSGGVLNTTRPIEIKAAYFTSGGIDYHMDPITDEEYASIPLKTTNSPFPDYYNYTNAYPLGTLKVYPALGTSATLTLLSEKPLTEFTTLNTALSAPPGWIRALRFNLALELAPEYGKEASNTVRETAAKSLGAIKLAIAKNRPIKYIPQDVRVGTIYDGWPS